MDQTKLAQLKDKLRPLQSVHAQVVKFIIASLCLNTYYYGNVNLNLFHSDLSFHSDSKASPILQHHDVAVFGCDVTNARYEDRYIVPEIGLVGRYTPALCTADTLLYRVCVSTWKYGRMSTFLIDNEQVKRGLRLNFM